MYRSNRVAQLFKRTLSSLEEAFKSRSLDQRQNMDTSKDNHTGTGSTNPLTKARIVFIGCGVMAEAIVAGLLRKNLVNPGQVVGSHPRSSRREELYTKYGLEMFENNREAVVAGYPTAPQAGSLVILGGKPPRAGKNLQAFESSIHLERTIAS